MTPQEQRLQHFVDRTSEMRRFSSLLDGSRPERPVVVVRGESGMGKTSLLLRMKAECDVRGVRHVGVTWTRTRNQDYLAVMRAIRDEVNAEAFPRFSVRADYFTNPAARLELLVHAGDVAVAQNAHISGSVGDIAAVKFQDCNFTVPRADLAISPEDIRAQLTDLFIPELIAVLAGAPFVLFLDAFQIAADATQAWIIDELTGALLEDRLGNVRIVLSGQERPGLPGDAWSRVEEMELARLGLEHIEQYVEKTRLATMMKDLKQAAVMLDLFTGGMPGALATSVDSIVRQLELQRAA